MKKRTDMALNKGKKKGGTMLERTHTGVCLAKRPATSKEHSLVSVHLHIVHSPALQGIGSLGNVSGGYVRFEKYMRGNYVRDMRRDWERVGECISDSMKTIK